jgi:glutathione S-transferase
MIPAAAYLAGERHTPTIEIKDARLMSTDKPIVFGAPYSVYVRAVRLALEEKGVDYELVPVDIFAEGGPPAEHLTRHPFGKIPVFEHAGFRLYEAGAITRYVDEAFAAGRYKPLTLGIGRG